MTLVVATTAETSAQAAAISWNPVFFNDAGLSNADFSTFQSSVNNALNYYSSTFSSPDAVTVNVQFHAGNTGLGQTDLYLNTIPYLSYGNALANTGTSANDTTALASLPATVGNPANGNSFMVLTLPLLRALGFAQGNAMVPYDASVTLNVGLMNLDRSAPANPSLYDLTQVVLHEANEVLGWTSALDGQPNSPITVPTGGVGPADLYRYSASGIRSFTTDPSQPAYFSINSGVTNIANFNVLANGDFHDFSGSPTISVQDAFSTPGTALNNSLAETTFLDVIGYNLNVSPVPEPASWMMMIGGFGFIGATMRRRKISVRFA